jgi:Flp pilus assembly secretin CpaC
MQHERSASPADLSLEREVAKAFAQIQQSLGLSEFKVSSRNGEVTLSGFVENQSAVQRALAVAEKVKDVKAVIMKLKLRPTEDTKDPDALARQARNNTTASPHSRP